MAPLPQSVAVVTIAVVGALVQAAVTIRLYEPPPPDDDPDAEPSPLFESVLFTVFFGIFYYISGVAIGAAETLPVVGPAVVAVVVVITLATAYATVTGRIRDEADAATRAMGIAATGTVGAIGVAVLVL